MTFHWEDEEPVRRRGPVVRTFLLTVLAAGVCVVLAGLLLWGVGAGGTVLWESFWEDA